MRAWFGVMVAVGLTSSVAHADDTEKSTATATALSVGVPAAGLVALTAGLALDLPPLGYAALGALVIGPSTGVWYAHGGSAVGLVARGVALAGVVVAAEVAVGLEECADATPACAANNRSVHRRQRVADGLVIGGLAVLAGSIVYDVIVARRAVETWNARSHAPIVTPTVLATPSGATSLGVAIGGRF